MTKITQEELEALVLEEIENLDEGLWSTLKGYASGIGSALTSPLGKVGQGYKRGKAASALNSAADRLEDVRREFIDDIEGLFKPIGSNEIAMPPELKDVEEAWSGALNDIEKAANTLKSLSAQVKTGGGASRSRAPWRQQTAEE